MLLNVVEIEKYYGTRNNLKKALDRVSFSVNSGDFVSIMGASGSGKTTPVSYTHLTLPTT